MKDSDFERAAEQIRGRYLPAMAEQWEILFKLNRIQERSEDDGEGGPGYNYH